MKKYILYLLFFAGFNFGCKKFTTIDFPINQVGSKAVFESDATAAGAVRGMYSEMMSNPNQFTTCALTFFAGLTADEMTYYQPSFRDEFIRNDISFQNHTVISGQFWDVAYKYIYVCNVNIEGLTASTKLSEAVKNRLLGECYYIRAFCYFNLVNLIGGVPLALHTDYRLNATLSRASDTAVYEQVKADLLKAVNLLPLSYELPDKAAPNKAAAQALLAKLYLYRAQWQDAKQMSSEIIGDGIYSLPQDLNSVFLKNSNETIWQLAPTIPTRNSWEGFYFNPNSNNSVPTYILRSGLLESFETGDLRKINWIKQRNYAGHSIIYPYKYKVKMNSNVTEYQVVMRLAEVFLIRAEAYARLNQVAEAVADINLIRERAGLIEVNSNISQDSCMKLVKKERRNEMFCEWGNRWYDLKRWGDANLVLGLLKGDSWDSTDALWPIPHTQIELNPNLQQNPGY